MTIREMTVGVTDEQPAPSWNDPHTFPAIWELVVQDMYEKDKAGSKKYGTRLQGFNGRSALVDAYQEALDLAVYLRQRIWEEDNGG